MSFRATALYNYDPTNSDELELCEGDEVLVTLCRDDGWFEGTNVTSKANGLFPGNYVEKIDATYGSTKTTMKKDEMPPEPAAGAAVPLADPTATSESKNTTGNSAAHTKSKPSGKRKMSTLKCAYWAQNTGMFSGACALMLGAMNFIWWSGDLQFGGKWPKTNDRITSPFMSQSVYGLGFQGFFPTEARCSPDPATLKDGNTFIYSNGKGGMMDYPDFRKYVQTNTAPPDSFFANLTIREMAGYYDFGTGGDGAFAAFIGPYTMLVGVLSFFLECCCTVKRPKDGCQHKIRCSLMGTLYFIVSIPMFLAVPTSLVGLMYMLSAIPHCLASKNEEFGEDKIVCGAREGNERHWTESSFFQKKTTFKEKASETFDSIQRGNQLGVCIFLALWILLHVILAIQRLVAMVILYRCSMFMRGDEMWGVENPAFIDECCQKPGAWDRVTDPVEKPGIYTGDIRSCSPNLGDPYSMNFRGMTDKQTSDPKLRVEVSLWVALAKVSGQLLNLNCAIVILPVARVFIGMVSNKLLNARGPLSAIIPIQKNITFHKFVAKTILVLAAIHTVSHFMGIASQPAMYYDNLQLSPWVTGYIIIFAQFCIFPAASDVVRRAMFRVFWANHHMFIIFLGALLVHGWQFYIWLSVPALLYMTERLGRFCRGNKPFYVKRIKWIPPVMEVRFCPVLKSDFVFKEGQYLFVSMGEFLWALSY